jgi:hypothetical protein
LAGNYAYVADNDAGVLVFDITDPTNPLLKGSINTPSYAYQVKVQGNYAYVAAHSAGMRVLDISNPANPTEIGSYFVSGYNFFDGIAVRGNYAYIAFEDGFLIIDITNPASPTKAGMWYGDISNFNCVTLNGDYAYVSHGSTSQIFDISVPSSPKKVGLFSPSSAMVISGNTAYLATGYGVTVNSFSSPIQLVETCKLKLYGNVYDIAVRDSLAYIANWDGGLVILNCKHPENIKQIGSYSYSIPHIAVIKLAVSGNYAYVAANDSGLRIIDVSNPALPHEVAVVKNPGKTTNVTVSGMYAYVLADLQGIRVLDVSDPVNPIQIGFIDTPAQASAMVIKGNLAFVADGTAGVRIVDISNPTLPVEIGFYDTPGWAKAVALKDNLLIVADGSGSIPILDISNPALPVLVWWYTEYEYYYDVYILGHFACFSTSHGGLTIFDIADPANTKKVGCYDKGGKQALALSGNTFYVNEAYPERGMAMLKVELPDGIGDGEAATNLSEVAYYQNNFEFSLASPARVELRVYDCTGKLVATPFSGRLTTGQQHIPFNTHTLSAGVYMYSLRAGSTVKAGKIWVED